MNVFLMHRDRDFDPRAPHPLNAADLSKDLELSVLLDVMDGGDRLIREVCETALLRGETDVDTIRYRQAVLADAIANPGVVHAMYDLAGKTLEQRRKSFFGVYMKWPSSILAGASGLMRILNVMLRKVRGICEAQATAFRSEGFLGFVHLLLGELGDGYLDEIQALTAELQFRAGVLESARLGDGNVSTDFVLRKPRKRRGWLRRIVGGAPASFGFRIADRDEGGARIVGEMKDQALNAAANALAQSADHVLGFFSALRTELAFYVGCLNLHDRLVTGGTRVCFPDPVAVPARSFTCRDLRDVALALTLGDGVVGSDVAAEGADVVFITGPNQGGKSTFLRSVGVAQLMMQSGMFVAAQSFRANVCRGVFTHFKREEDSTMTNGKLGEELQRMSGIVDNLGKHSLVLFNESFAATNEREGSGIARQVVTALREIGIKVLYVTHLYELARGFRDRGTGGTVFLRAERCDDGSRTFRIVEGEPLETSFGEDLYQRIFLNGPESGAGGWAESES